MLGSFDSSNEAPVWSMSNMNKGTSRQEMRIVGSDRNTDSPPNEINISIQTFSICIM